MPGRQQNKLLFAHRVFIDKEALVAPEAVAASSILCRFSCGVDKIYSFNSTIFI